MVPTTEGHVTRSRRGRGRTDRVANLAGTTGENSGTCGESVTTVDRTEGSGMRL